MQFDGASLGVCISNKWHLRWQRALILPKSPHHFLRRVNSGLTAGLHRVKSNQAPRACQLGVGCHPATNPPHFASKRDRWLLSLSSGVVAFRWIISCTPKPFSPSFSPFYLFIFQCRWFSFLDSPLQLQADQTTSTG